MTCIHSSRGMAAISQARAMLEKRHSSESMGNDVADRSYVTPHQLRDAVLRNLVWAA
ncbi:MAG: hypothetical protein PHX10_07980 [Gallionellaceae bacterium]|nr:hypothetical protein [Gallionellaceae bacterium]